MFCLGKYCPWGRSGKVGITGCNPLSWEEKFKLDVWYVDNQSLWLDMKIIFLTVWKVIARQGISAAGEATMPVFKGTQLNQDQDE